MRSRHLILFLFTMMFVSPFSLAQSSKQELNDQFWEAVRKGEVESVTALLDKGADVNAKFRYGTTALFKAAERGHVEIVKILLARGADVTVKDTFYGATAMSWALDHNHADVVRLLLDKEPKSVDEVLITGVQEGKLELVNMALTKGGLTKETLTTALVLATDDKDKAELANILKKAGAIAPPEVNATTLQSYVGKYKNDAGLEASITLTNGRLVAIPAGQRPQPLIPIDETSFRVLFDPSVGVKFKVNEGKVVGLALTERGTTTQWTRLTEPNKP